MLKVESMFRRINVLARLNLIFDKIENYAREQVMEGKKMIKQMNEKLLRKFA